MEKQRTRRERDRERRIGEVLDAAEAVFAEKGYERARVSDIARRAEFSVGYLYQTWKGKEDLYVSLIEAKFREFKSYLEEKIQAAPGPTEQIEVLIDAHLAFIDRNKRFAKLFLVETYPPERRILTSLGTHLKRVHADYLDLVAGIFERGVKRGVFAPVEPRDLALALEGMLTAFVKHHVATSPSADLTRKGRVMKQIFFEPVARTPAEKKTRVKKAPEKKKESRRS
jgi:AcrR family transcriptional regulator